MIQSDNLTRRFVPCIIRDYTPDDFEACKTLYASNVPQPLSEENLEDCLRFLEEGTSYHLVLERDGKVIGCGGLELRGEGPYAHLVHGSIHKDFHRQGYGSTLLAARLALIEHEGLAYAVKLETGTDSSPFFAQAGFTVGQVRINGCGPGKDSGILFIEIQPEEIDDLRNRLAAAGVNIQIAEPTLEVGVDEAFFEADE